MCPVSHRRGARSCEGARGVRSGPPAGGRRLTDADATQLAKQHETEAGAGGALRCLWPLPRRVFEHRLVWLLPPHPNFAVAGLGADTRRGCCRRSTVRPPSCFLCTPDPLQYLGGEPCGICGHRLEQVPGSVQHQHHHQHQQHQQHQQQPASASTPLAPPAAPKPPSAFPSEIVPGFLFLGSYDHASRQEVLKTLGVASILSVSWGVLFT